MSELDHMLVSDFRLFSVRFRVRQVHSDKFLYTGAVRFVARQGTPDDEIYRDAEKAARSWGAFADPEAAHSVDHHFYDRRFEALSIEPMGQVDGMSAIGQALADYAPKLGWD